MIRVALVALILLTTHVAHADATGEYLRACLMATKSPSSDVAPVLQKEIDSCKERFKQYRCEEVTKDWPALQARLRTCTAEEICHGGGNPASAMWGWGHGFYENAKDGLVALKDYFAKGYEDSKATFELGRKCDAIPECKRAMAEEVPWRKNSSDEDLKNVSSLRLTSESLVNSGLQKLKGASATVYNCLESPSSIQQTATGLKDSASKGYQAATDWIAKNLVLNTLRYHCVDAQGQGELIGYATAYVLDPLIAAGAVAKSTYLKEALSMSKAGLTDAVATSARVQASGEGTSGKENVVGAATKVAGGDAARTVERREAESLGAKKTRDEARTPTRAGLIDDYLEKVYASPKQNTEFAKLAARTVPDGKTKFVDIENSVMKKLNDQTRDKNLVTSLTNRHKEIVFQKLEALKKANPGLEIVPYSDFKSVRVGAKGKVPANFEEQVQAALKSANDEFAKDLAARGVVRQGDKPADWFRAGFGETADQANLAARAAREQLENENKMLNFSSPALQTRMTARLNEVEAMRAQTIRELSSTPLVEAGSKPILTREAFDMVRKYSDADSLQSAVQARYGLTDFSKAKAESMLSYAKAVDEFSPGIHVTKREIVNLDNAKHGGFSVDFLGLGSSNQSATAAALARSGGLSDALVQTRMGEQAVTKEFRDRIDAFKKVAGKYAKCTGDDCIGQAAAPITHKQKVDLQNKLAADDRTRGIRLSFIPEGIVSKADRTTLATHGESIEKFFRKYLEGKVPNEKLKDSMFAIDMQTKLPNAGGIDLIAASKPGVRWSSKEWDEIQGALGKAVEAHNKDLAKENIKSSYYSVRSSCANASSIRSCVVLPTKPSTTNIDLTP